MKLIKIGIIALLVLGLSACGDSKPAVIELTETQIQADVIAHLSDVYSEVTVEDFAVASNTELRETKTVIGTMSLKTPISSLTGNYTNVYELVGKTWTLESSLFTPKLYTWIDPSTWPDQARVEADLMKSTLKFPIEKIEKLEYTLNDNENSALETLITVTYRSSIGTVTSQLESGYVFMDQVWTFGLGLETSISIKDFTQQPDPADMLEWSIMPFVGGDAGVGIATTDSHLVSSNFDDQTGTLVNVYHVDKWVSSRLHYKADTTVKGIYDIYNGWDITVENSVVTKTLDLNVKERFVWETVDSNDTMFALGQTVDLNLSGSMSITTPKESLWDLNVSGTVKINGVTYTLIFDQPDPLNIYDNGLVMRYGPGAKEYFILYHAWLEDKNKKDWILLTPYQSEALIGS